MESLPNGVLVPKGSELISRSGVDEMRALGMSADAAMAVIKGQIEGLEGMTYVGAWSSGVEYQVNNVVTHGGDSWARLTAGSAGEPGADPAAWGLVARKGDGGGFGDLTETAVTGLYDTVPPASTLPDTGFLTVTANFPQVTRGSVTVRRLGATVYVTLLDIEFANSTPPEFFYLTGLLPVGYRPPVFTSFAALADVNGTVTRRIRFQQDGQILLYQITPTSRINVTASYLTPDPWPAP